MVSGRLTGTDASGDPVDIELFVVDNNIYFRIPESERAALEAQGHPDPQWVGRPFSPESAPLDGALQVLALLASAQPENPAALQQQGVIDLGNDEVGGREARAFKAPNTTFWVTDDGLLLRVEATLPALTAPFAVELTDHGERDLPASAPEDATIVDGAGMSPDEFGTVSGAGDIGARPDAPATTTSAP